MKKTLLLIATLLISFAASATVHNVSSSLSWWIAGSDSPVQPGDTLLVADGEYVEQWSFDCNKEGLVVIAAEGAKPVVKASSYLKIHANITFDGIIFDGLNTANYALTSRGNTDKLLTLNNCEFKNYLNYFIYVESATNISLAIENCLFDGANTTKAALFAKGIATTSNIQGGEFKNFAEHAITVEKWYGGRFDALTINNSLFHDCTKSAIYFPYAIDTNEKQTCSNFELTNSTIYNIGNGESFGTIDIQDNANIASSQHVEIDHVTIYNFLNSGYHGAIKVENSADAVVTNCIVMNTVQEWANPYRLFTGAQVSNCIYYNTEISSESTATFTNCTKADPMFVDAANANFQLYAESPAVGAGTDDSNLGDPRWGVKAGLRPGNGALKKAVAAAAPGATIELGDGEYVETSSIDFNKEGLIIKAADGTKPVIKASSYLKHNATTTFIGITFDGQGAAEYTTYSYETGTEKDLTFTNCEFKGYTKSCITLGSAADVNKLLVDGCTFDGGNTTPAAIKSSGIISECVIQDSEIKGYTEYGFVANSSSAHTEELSIDNCIIHDCGYAAVYVCKASDSSEKQSCSSFELTNSTIYNVGDNTKDHGAVDIRDNANIASTQQVLIDHVTLYNFTTKDWYGGFMIHQSGNATISNCIVSNPASGKNGYHVYANANVTNSLYYNCNITSGAQQNANINADPMFVDAANTNFQLYANSPAVGAGTDMSNLGDPRWGVSAKVLGKRIYVTPDEDLRYYVITDPNVKVGDTLVLANGTYNISSTTEFSKEGLVVMADENAKPEIKLTDTGGYASLKLNNGTTFDGITFNGTGISNYLVIANGTDASKFVFNNCEFKNYVYYAISDPWTDNYENGRHVDSILINNCLFHDGGAAINLSKYGPLGKHTCDYFEMKNSTIYNISNTGNAAILVSSNAENTGVQNKVVLDHITMYNYANANYGAIAIRKSSDLQITNSIIANPTSGLYAFYIYGGTINNTLYYNATYDSDATYTACITEDPLFVDAANNDFMLQANSPAIGAATDGSDLGDPRWGVEPATVVEFGDADNSAAIAANTGNTMDVQINRSFTAVGEWYTICFPFSIPQDQQSKLGTIYTVGDLIAVANGEGVNISIQPISGPTTAYKAYLVKPSAAITNPVFEGVTIEEGEPIAWSSTADNYTMEFVGTINAGGQTDGSQYYIGDNGYLYNGVVDILGLRAFFTFTENGQPAKVRARVVAGTNATTGVDNVVVPEGQVLKVIENGQLIIIRGGEKFNVQGQRL